MNAFQILDKDNTPISLRDLDKDAAFFWEVQQDSKYYASPQGPSNQLDYSLSWYDTIGYAIANPEGYTSGWHDIVLTIHNTILKDLTVNLKQKDSIEINSMDYMQVRLESAIRYTAPYINLIKYWMAKGYTPKQVKE